MINSKYYSESVETALRQYLEAIEEESLEPEFINVEDSISRILYEDIVVNSDFPAYQKALIDGYALNSEDIYYADKFKPAVLKLVSEVNVGDKAQISIKKNEAVKISKGSILPENADAVLPPESAEVDGSQVKVLRSAITGYNVAQRGEDLKINEVLIKKKRKLRPQDIGGIIGVGYRQVKVYKRPNVTIIPTGSELVPVDVTPDAGQIIASNGYVLKGFIEQLGGVARVAAIVKDELEMVKNSIIKALEVSDMVLVCGGSSIGEKDYTLGAIKEIENSVIFTHGVPMRPGGHVLLATINGKPVIGLPGHVVSNMTCFHVFAKPVLNKIAGTPRSFWQERKDTIKINAVLEKNIQSPDGKEDYVRVRLREDESGRIIAYPYAGKSSFLSTLVKSHGIIQLCAECTGLYKGDTVEVILI